MLCVGQTKLSHRIEYSVVQIEITLVLNLILSGSGGNFARRASFRRSVVMACVPHSGVRLSVDEFFSQLKAMQESCSAAGSVRVTFKPSE